MKALKFSTRLPLLALTLLTCFAQINLSVAAQTEIIRGDHNTQARHYENLATEAKTRLQENRAILEKYEAHPYYYGRQGQDLKSHTVANIREYEKALKENLINADLHRKMAIESNYRVNKARINSDRNLSIN